MKIVFHFDLISLMDPFSHLGTETDGITREDRVTQLHLILLSQTGKQEVIHEQRGNNYA